MLAVSDVDGIVEADLDELAKLANLTKSQVKQAIQALQEVEDDGTTAARVLPVPGGWFVCNHPHYRDRRTKKQQATAERVRLCRERKKQQQEQATPKPATAAPAASEDVTKPDPAPLPARRPDDVPRSTWSQWTSYRQTLRASTSQGVVDALRDEAEKVGLTLADAMSVQSTNGWRGFRATWIKRPRAEV